MYDADILQFVIAYKITILEKGNFFGFVKNVCLYI